jgi:hypothetical protein
MSWTVEIVDQQAKYNIEIVLNPVIKFYNDGVLTVDDIEYDESTTLAQKLDLMDVAIAALSGIKGVKVSTHNNKTGSYDISIAENTHILHIGVSSSAGALVNAGTTDGGTELIDTLNVAAGGFSGSSIDTTFPGGGTIFFTITGTVNIYILYIEDYPA